MIGFWANLLSENSQGLLEGCGEEIAAVALVFGRNLREQLPPRFGEVAGGRVGEYATPQRVLHRLEIAAMHLKSYLAALEAIKDFLDFGRHGALDRRGRGGDSLRTSGRVRYEHPQCFLTRDHLVVTVDTLAEDARTGAHSAGAKLLLIPQHNLVLATRGSTQFFLRIYELTLQASFRADFTMEQLSAELGLVVDQLWPNYEDAVAEAGLPIKQLGTELVFGGWSPKNDRMMAMAYAKSDSRRPCVVQPIGGGSWRRRATRSKL